MELDCRKWGEDYGLSIEVNFPSFHQNSKLKWNDIFGRRDNEIYFISVKFK